MDDYKLYQFSENEIDLLIALIRDEQMYMLLDNDRYNPSRYKALEQLKIKIKDM